MTPYEYGRLWLDLSPDQQELLDGLEHVMTRKLGSAQAFRLWLDCHVTGYTTTPADAIRAGLVALVLDIQRPDPGYTPA
jgi:hypothetical protein